VIYHFELHCREEFNNNQYLRLFVNTYDDQAKDFCGETAENMDVKSFENFKNHLLKFRNYISVIIEENKFNNGSHFYRVVGSYENKL
jgi:hypothetical protein